MPSYVPRSSANITQERQVRLMLPATSVPSPAPVDFSTPSLLPFVRPPTRSMHFDRGQGSSQQVTRPQQYRRTPTHQSLMKQIDGVSDPAAVLELLCPERGSSSKETATAAKGDDAETNEARSTADKFVFSDLNRAGAFVLPDRPHRRGRDPENCVSGCCPMPLPVRPLECRPCN